MAILYERYQQSDSGTSIWGEMWRAQTFTPSVGHTITKAVLLKYSEVGSMSEITISIRATDGDGKPTGGDLTVGTVSPPFGGSISVTFTTSYALSLSVKYAIVARMPGGTPTDRFNLGFMSATGTYAGGHALSSIDGGATWLFGGGGLGELTSDFWFEEWGEGVVPGTATLTTTLYTPVVTATTGLGFIPKIFYF